MSPAAGVAQFLRLKQRFFTAAQLFLRALTVGGVHHRSNKLELTRLISFSMSHNVDMFHRTIRHHQAIFMLKILSILRRTLNGFFHRARVFRMTPLEETSTGGFVDRSYWKIRKVSSDQRISPMEGLQPKLPVLLRRCASARKVSLWRSASSARLRSPLCVASRSARSTDGTSLDNRVFRM